MPVRSKKIIPVKAYIPPSSTAAFALKVTRKDGTIDDLSNLSHLIEIEDGATESIGRFMFELWDPNETYKNAWQGMEEVKYYSDYAASATTLRFKGRIEKISHQGMKLRVTGRTNSLQFLEITVIKSYDDTECSEILQDLIDSYGKGNFTYTNIETSSTNLTVNWYQKPFWECVQELCIAAGFDAYVDCSDDFHFFEIDSRPNNDEAVIHDYNLLSIGDFAKDIAQTKNRVIVHGAVIDGIQEIYTAENSSSQSDYEIREDVINDEGIIGFNQARDVGDNRLKSVPLVGEVTCPLLASIQPGQSIHLSSPADNIEPKLYPIISYRHNIGNGLTTTLRISKEPRKVTHILKSMINKTQQQASTSNNPEGMKYTYNFLFDSDSGSHSNTEILNGFLKLQTGKNNGIWTSPLRTLSDSPSEAYLILKGETLTGASVEVSATNGINWQTISNKSKITFQTGAEKNIMVRVKITDGDTQIDSLSMQYK